MAHNIYFNSNNNRHSFFSVKEKAWHGLGQIVSEHPTSEEAIIHAGLDYEVERKKLFTKEPDTQVTNYYATVRADTQEILGIVGSKYEIVQNRTAFSFFDALVSDAGGIKYETAGALGNGERIFITAKLPDVMRIGREDIIEEYIFLTTSHDGSGSIMAAFTPVRIVCNNTLNMALKNHSNSVFIKHTANAEAKLKEAGKIISLSNNMHSVLEPMFNKWARTRINDRELKKLVQLAMAPTPEVFQAVAGHRTDFEFSKHFETVVDEVMAYAMTSATQTMDTTAGTLYGAYNAVTGYLQNVKVYKNDDSKVNSIMYGLGKDQTKKAFEICSTADNFLN